MVEQLTFYLFALVAVVAALRVITARNPVHSVLFLVLTFFSMSGIFVLLGAEFLAAILIMVYMGAVAILFLFVVMMLDVDFTQLRKGAINHLPLGIAVGIVILVELAAVAMNLHLSGEVNPALVEQVPNTMAIGKILYTKYLFPFEIASIVLLVALVGAVVLTLRKPRPGLKRQVISEQLARTREQSVEMKKVASGEGA
ncbi:MAG: NADH-quinone oxidoreductase subunit J [Magnetococcales bacterium]|nr:NADH-quinone oxidoreductase subunit J [Magnetococcales bacterium]